VQNTGPHTVSDPLALTGPGPISTISGNLGPTDTIDSYEFTRCTSGFEECASTRELKINASFVNTADSICLNLYLASDSAQALDTACGAPAFLDALNLAEFGLDGTTPLDYILTVTDNGGAVDPPYNLFFETPVDPVSPAAVPEPTSLAILGVAPAALGAIRHRKRCARQTWPIELSDLTFT